MHTVLIASGGFVLLGVMLFACRLLDGAGQELAPTIVAKLFIPIWLGCAFLNLWFCISIAGHAITQELLNFLAIFTLPTSAAVMVVRRANPSD